MNQQVDGNRSRGGRRRGRRTLEETGEYTFKKLGDRYAPPQSVLDTAGCCSCVAVLYTSEQKKKTPKLLYTCLLRVSCCCCPSHEKTNLVPAPVLRDLLVNSSLHPREEKEEEEEHDKQTWCIVMTMYINSYSWMVSTDCPGYLRKNVRNFLFPCYYPCMYVAPRCHNGFLGVGSSDGLGDICCVAKCGVCGGRGCSDVGKKYGLDKDDCCTGPIYDSGHMCSDKKQAPCIIDDDFKSDTSSGVYIIVTTAVVDFFHDDGSYSGFRRVVCGGGKGGGICLTVNGIGFLLGGRVKNDRFGCLYLIADGW